MNDLARDLRFRLSGIVPGCHHFSAFRGPSAAHELSPRHGRPADRRNAPKLELCRLSSTSFLQTRAVRDAFEEIIHGITPETTPAIAPALRRCGVAGSTRELPTCEQSPRDAFERTQGLVFNRRCPVMRRANCRPHGRPAYPSRHIRDVVSRPAGGILGQCPWERTRCGVTRSGGVRPFGCVRLGVPGSRRRGWRGRARRWRCR